MKFREAGLRGVWNGIRIYNCQVCQDPAILATKEAVMETLEITLQTPGWQELIAQHLAVGDRVTVKIETPSLSPAQAAAALNVSRSAVQQWIMQGKIRSERHGTYHRIPVREVERFRAERIRGIAEDDFDAIHEDLHWG